MAITLYHNEVSGHSHRVRLFLSLLDVPCDLVRIDLSRKEQKLPEYIKLNPLGQIPTLVDGDTVITDSTAALVYLAKKYDSAHTWLPEDPVTAAIVQTWLSTASGELYRGPASARAIKLQVRPGDYEAAQSCATQLFQWMQNVLSGTTWLAANHVTIADIAMYSYIRIADEGGLDITPFPAITRWLADIEKLERFIPMHRIMKA